MKITIGEAIRILTLMGTLNFEASSENILAARKLGIKALERFRNLRDSGQYVGMPYLKGEKSENPL